MSRLLNAQGAFLARGADPQTVDEWLTSLGLAQYIPAFHAAGYDDLATLAYLNPTDLNLIGQASGTAVLPGHRKRLLLAAPRLQGLKPAKRRPDGDGAAAGGATATSQQEGLPTQSEWASAAPSPQVGWHIVRGRAHPEPSRERIL